MALAWLFLVLWNYNRTRTQSSRPAITNQRQQPVGWLCPCHVVFQSWLYVLIQLSLAVTCVFLRQRRVWLCRCNNPNIFANSGGALDRCLRPNQGALLTATLQSNRIRLYGRHAPTADYSAFRHYLVIDNGQPTRTINDLPQGQINRRCNLRLFRWRSRCP